VRRAYLGCGGNVPRGFNAGVCLSVMLWDIAKDFLHSIKNAIKDVMRPKVKPHPVVESEPRSNPPPTEEKRNHSNGPFTRENRVRLFYAVLGLLPLPKPDGLGGVTGGAEIYKLEKLLKWEFGRLSIGGEYEIAERIQSFILRAPEAELLTLIRLVPTAIEYAIQEERSPFRRNPAEATEHAMKTLNSFLEYAGSAARFINGTFYSEGVVTEIPESLRRLPDKPALLRDTDNYSKDAKPIGLIFVDLDGFKSVNDSLGHQSGDKCLEKVVETIGTAIAGKGRLYRYGGDEFVVLLPNFLIAEATATAERIRASIDAADPGSPIKITASIGIASSDQPKLRTAEELIKAADEAMYVSKNSGKNRVTSWPLTHEGQQLQPRAVFEAEFKGGKYIVYLSERGASPFTSICATFRIYNRRASSTTILCDSFRVKLDGSTDDFPLPDIKPLGAIGPVLEIHDREQIGANSIIDLNFFSRKYYPEPIPDAYLSRKKVRFVALLKETFGASVEAEGELECGDIVRQ